MFDIGIGEILLLAVLGLLVFGPEKLPKAAADAGRLIRQLREMAAGARKDLADSAGLDLSEARDTLRDLSDLHPRKLAAGLLEDVNPTDGEPASGRPAGRTSKPPGAAKPSAPSEGAGPASAAAPPTAAFDPDAT